VTPAPAACYGFSPALLRAAAARAARVGWATVARESGRQAARRLAALERAAACEAAAPAWSCPGWAHYNAADAAECSAVLLDYAARVAFSQLSFRQTLPG